MVLFAVTNPKSNGNKLLQLHVDIQKRRTSRTKRVNDQGGIDPKTEEEMKKAQKADLITLPGGTKAALRTRNSVTIKE